MFYAFLGIGTNLGNRKNNLKRCSKLIEEKVGKIQLASSIYETEPWGVENQENYYNQVLKVRTKLSPLTLLYIINGIEKEMGRVRRQKWESRIIDIDILFFKNFRLNTSKLVVPHPFLSERNFVLKPLAEIAPDFIHPEKKKSVLDLLEACKDNSWIKKAD